VNEAVGCRLGNSGGAEYWRLGWGFAAMGDGFRLRLVEGEELSGATRSARARQGTESSRESIWGLPGREQDETDTVERLTTWRQTGR
jgi:hypothetical protein